MDKRIHIHVYSLVFPGLHRDIHVDSGASIADMLWHIGFPRNSGPYLKIAFQGFGVPEEQWGSIKPKPGTHIQIGVMPADDNPTANKDMLRQAAIIASVVGGYLIPGALGISGIGQALLQAAITYGGFWAATTLMPYSNQQPVVANQLTSARNQARPYGVVPKPYGRMRVFPPLAAAPQTELRQNDQYIELLMVVGYKPLYVDVATMKIGETPLSEYDGVQYEISDGWHNRDDITLFSGDIDEQLMDQEIAYAEQWRVNEDGIPIPPSSTVESKTAPGVVSLTTPSNTARIDIDFTFPEGLGIKSDSSFGPHTVDLQVQYRPVGQVAESSWISHIPNTTEMQRLFHREAELATRAKCIEWIVELTAIIGDIVNAANLHTATRNAEQDLIDSILNTANNLARTMGIGAEFAVDLVGITPITGEVDAMENLKFQINQVVQLARLVQRESDPEDLVYSKEFLSYFAALYNPMRAAFHSIQVRRLMGNADIADRQNANFTQLVDISGSIPEVFQTVATDAFTFSPSEVRAGIVRRNLYFQVPEGKYEVRIRKTRPDAEDENTLEEVHVTAFRCHRTRPALSDNMRSKLALIAISVLATDQLTGSLDQFSVEVETPLHYTTDGETWLGPALVDADNNNVSRNPAWAMVDILTQAPNYKAVPLSRIDGPNMLEFAMFCTENTLRFDHNFDQRSTVHRCTEDACRVAKASPTIRDGRYAVVYDRPQLIPRAVISIANASRFEAGKTMQKRAQALRIGFKNPARDWSDDEIYVYDDGFGDDANLVYRNEVVRATVVGSLSLAAIYEDITGIYDIGDTDDLNIDNYSIGTNTARTKTVITPRSSPYNFREGGNYNVKGHVMTRLPERIEEISIPGLVDVPGDPLHPYYSNQVYKLGRYLLATAKLRPETFKATLDFEHLVFERGDRVEVQMDTVLWGLGASRIRSLTRVVGGPNAGKIESITTEQDLFVDDGVKYAVRLRGSQNNITGEATFYYDETEPSTITLEVPMNDASTPFVKGDLLAWGVPSKATIGCIVTEIRPQRDMAAEVTMIQYSPGVYEAENGPIPEFDPRITIPPNPERQRPPAPSIIKVTTDESVLERDTDGSYASRIVIDIVLPQGSTRAERDAAAKVDAIHVQFRRSLDAESTYRPEWIRVGVYSRDITRVSIRDVEDGYRYDVRIRAVTQAGSASIWSEMQNILVIGKTSPPPDVENLRWIGDKISWDFPNPPVDHAGYLVRYFQGFNGHWGDAIPAHTGRLLVTEFGTEISYEANRTYFVKAVDTSGIESLNAKSVSGLGANIPGVYEHTRFNDTFFGGDFTEVGDVFELDAYVGSQSGLPFYKGLANNPFYSSGTTDAFYQRTYGPLDRVFALGIWSGPVPAGQTARWIPEVKMTQGPPYVIKARAVHLLLWPELLVDPLWPSSLSEDFWPVYFRLEPLRPSGIPHVQSADIDDEDGVTAIFKIMLPGSNVQAKFTGLGAVLVVPLRYERVHDFACVTTTPGTGDEVTFVSEFLKVVSVDATLQGDDPGGSVRAEKSDGTVDLFVYDTDGGRTTGVVDVTAGGY